MAGSRFIMTATVILALLACACAQNWNADDARQLGTPSSNYCGALCNEAAKRNTNLAKLVPFCNTECRKCVDGVAKTQQGKKEALPAACQTAFRFKEITTIIEEWRSGKLSAERGA